LLDEDPTAAMRQMARDRFDLYAEVADLTIDVTRRSPQEIADEVLDVIGGE
jgi:shikimate kinase